MAPPYHEPETVESTTTVAPPSKEPEAHPHVFSKEIDKDRELKKKIVVDLITSHCINNENSEFEDFCIAGEAIKNGDKLDATVISGGATNYSYKVFLESGSGPAFYAKIAFPYALWNPDRSVYDTARTANEYVIMKRINKVMGEKAPVATPYLCQDVDDMKILVCQWSPTDEQWANQFIEGEVDHRIIPKVAQALASLNLAPFDDEIGPDFNEVTRTGLESVFPVVLNMGIQLINADDTIDSCVAYIKELGQERFEELVANCFEKNYTLRECITHADAHCFNILVEKKPTSGSTFGDGGNFAICDWEMAAAGPHGRDAGFLLGWPAACALTHAAHGRREVAYDLLDCCVEFWDEYAKIFVEQGNKDEAFMLKTFRTCLGWNALFLFTILYNMRNLTQFLPTDKLSEEMATKSLGSIGLVGIKLMEYGFGDKEADLSLDELSSRYRSTIEREIECLLEAASKYETHPRRESFLRATGRRVSDASFVQEVTRRLSQTVTLAQ